MGAFALVRQTAFFVFLLGLLGGSAAPGLGAQPLEAQTPAAQTPAVQPVLAQPPQTPRPAESDEAGWSVGTSLTYPVVRIFPVHINRRLDARREIFFGPAYQGWTSGTITSDVYNILLGYRHYLWRGLHVELELWPGWGHWYSTVTDRRYAGWELWAEPKIGYRFHLTPRFYLQPAPGVGFGIFRTNRPPRFDEDIDSPIFVPQLILGVKF
ncbi:MAG: hypothetical protein EA422_13595 [Gemmatimonadales bacterium]|nr:MAG: hypothetical protein EA422_13595 [Gemmatimonadales bacterium]